MKGRALYTPYTEEDPVRTYTEEGRGYEAIGLSLYEVQQGEGRTCPDGPVYKEGLGLTALYGELED
jgi:hypothetical protein